MASDSKAESNEPPKWGYGTDNGPHMWSKYFKAGMGSHQSPIDIDASSANVRYDGTLKPLSMDYAPFSAKSLKNTGASFQIVFSDEPNINELSGGPFQEDVYQLVQIHAHWSAKNDRGSEHTINGRAFPAEMHFVHFNKSKYASVSEAVQYPDGLAVIGVFFKIGQRHAVLGKIFDEFNRIRYADQEVLMVNQPIDVRGLMPSNVDNYWTYNGSLTTPPLAECVKWVVLEQPIEVSNEQLTACRELSRVTYEERASNVNQSMEYNFRPTMPINDRIVRASFR